MIGGGGLLEQGRRDGELFAAHWMGMSDKRQLAYVKEHCNIKEIELGEVDDKVFKASYPRITSKGAQAQSTASASKPSEYSKALGQVMAQTSKAVDSTIAKKEKVTAHSKKSKEKASKPAVLKLQGQSPSL